MSTTTEAATAATSTRTRTRGRNRAEYRVAGAAMREARARFSQARAEGRIKCKASAEIMLTLLAEIGGYSRTNDTMSIRQIEEMTGIPRSTVARSLEELEAAGCISLVRVERGRRGLIALPVVEPPEAPVEEAEDLVEEEIEELVPARVGVPREAGRCPTHGMGHTEKTAPEKKEEVCAEVKLPSRARESVRPDGTASHTPGLQAADSTRITVIEPHPDVAGLHPDVHAAYLAALEKTRQMLDGGAA